MHGIFWVKSRLIGNRALCSSRISFRNWLFMLKSFQIPATTLHLLLLLEMAKFGHNWMWSPSPRSLSSDKKDSFVTVPYGVLGSFRWVLIKLFTVASVSSPADSGIPENTRLSIVLLACSVLTVFNFFYFLSSTGSHSR